WFSSVRSIRLICSQATRADAESGRGCRGNRNKVTVSIYIASLTKTPMNLGQKSSALILAAAYLVAGTVDTVGADSNSEADRLADSSGKQTESKLVEQPPAKRTEPWIITVGAPGWLANVSGISGFHGAKANISVDVAQILRHINVI